MNKQEFIEDFDEFIHLLKITTSKRLPMKTGNLSQNAYKIEATADGYKLWIDESVAYYVIYLDENNFKHYDYLEWDELATFIVSEIERRYTLTTQYKKEALNDKN